MAVFTKLSKEDIENLISDYTIGNLDNFEEIVDGIENSNFKIFCNNQPYILTIFEKRVTEEELPFFINLNSEIKYNFKEQSYKVISQIVMRIVLYASSNYSLRLSQISEIFLI